MQLSPFHENMSRVLQRLDAITSRVSATVVMVIVLLTFNVILAVQGFPTSWQAAFATISNSVVLIFLFSFKHTEHRGLAALQLKLDEVIRAIPTADDHLVQIERADENEFGAREKEQISVHQSLRGFRDDTEY
ncbi:MULTISPECIES: low affinity iron permease family protein [Acidithrix]|uniref:Low affinity iron permease n=2 Tax=root TaxID=1 RepID=A0A0D8HDL8_9ACTN|nr:MULTISPECIES: low affinity iron permease family protein [Acidithrix]KJF16028.1 Low affinity iron permease [Acidithrix ferrooxidans]